MENEQDKLGLIKAYINGTSSQDADLNKILEKLRISNLEDLHKIKSAIDSSVSVSLSEINAWKKRKKHILSEITQFIDKNENLRAESKSAETSKKSSIVMVIGAIIAAAIGAIALLATQTGPPTPNGTSEEQTFDQMQGALEIPISVDFKLLKSSPESLVSVDSVEIVEDGNTIEPGELFWLTFTPKELGHVYFFLRDPSNQTYTLFPPNSDIEIKDIEHRNPVSPDEKYSLPKENSSYVRDDTPGKHIIYTIFLKRESEKLLDIARGLLSFGKIEQSHIVEKNEKDLLDYIDTLAEACPKCVKTTRFN